MSEDLLDDDSYFLRPEYQPQCEEQSEDIQIAMPIATPESRKRILHRIAHSASESFSVRADAQRLLELADCFPREFCSRYTEFIEWRQKVKK